jgi:hypothetical protein
MGAFTRSGTFQDRGRFVEALKGKIAKLKDGPLRGMEETWTPGSPETCTIAGFGAKVVFTVGAKDWSCDVSIPSWIPIPQASVEERFDREFEDLKGV